VDAQEPQKPQEQTVKYPSEDLARLIAEAKSVPAPAPTRASARVKLFGAILIAGIGIGASVLSCIGQSFSLRQARALEGIEQQLMRIQAACPAPPEALR
jgi:hypothetical protein